LEISLWLIFNGGTSPRPTGGALYKPDAVSWRIGPVSAGSISIAWLEFDHLDSSSPSIRQSGGRTEPAGGAIDQIAYSLNTILVEKFYLRPYYNLLNIYKMAYISRNNFRKSKRMNFSERTMLD
jgi:hypothetical protein